jgi:hypothetical protein
MASGCTRPVLVPKGARNAPILLTRTPYDATGLTSHSESAHLGPILSGYDNAHDVIVEGGYIRVGAGRARQVRSEGDYVMNRPLRGRRTRRRSITRPTPTTRSTGW